MGVEVKKFFFCIPLKESLLLCGYLNLLFIVNGINNQYENYAYNYIDPLYFTMDILIFSVYFIELIVTIIFISGMYKNQPKKIKTFFWYKMVISIGFFLSFAIHRVYNEVLLSEQEASFYEGEKYTFHLYNLIVPFAVLGISMTFMIYVLVAIRGYYKRLERQLTRDTDELYKSTNNLLQAGKTLKDDFDEFTNETCKMKSIVF